MDIRSLSLEQLRTSISFVMQDVFLFSDTINDNIKLGKKRFSTLPGHVTDCVSADFLSSSSAADTLVKIILRGFTGCL